MVVRVLHFSIIIFFWFKFIVFFVCVFSFVSFAFEVKSFEEALSVMSYVQIYKTD